MEADAAQPDHDDEIVIEMAVTANYDGLVGLMRSRREELGLTCVELDALAGLQDGYTSKVECYPSNHHRTLGIVSLPLMLGALGLVLAVVKVEPPRAVRKFHKTLPPKQIESQGPRMPVRSFGGT